jgi:hypothetical protein
MATWTKKISKAAEEHLQPGEAVVAGVFLQPPGTMGQAVGRGVGGLIGKAVVAKLQGSRDDGRLVTDSGIAATFPKEPTVIGVTGQRLLVFGYGAIGGKPKGLRRTLPVSDLVSVTLEKQKATSSFVLHFNDGTSAIFEAPRMANDPEAFAAAVNGG